MVGTGNFLLRFCETVVRTVRGMVDWPVNSWGRGGRVWSRRSVAIGRLERFCSVLGRQDGILGRGGRFWSVRSVAIGRFGAFCMVLDCILDRGERFGQNVVLL